MPSLIFLLVGLGRKAQPCLSAPRDCCPLTPLECTSDGGLPAQIVLEASSWEEASLSLINHHLIWGIFHFLLETRATEQFLCKGKCGHDKFFPLSSVRVRVRQHHTRSEPPQLPLPPPPSTQPPWARQCMRAAQVGKDHNHRQAHLLAGGSGLTTLAGGSAAQGAHLGRRSRATPRREENRGPSLLFLTL